MAYIANKGDEKVSAVCGIIQKEYEKDESAPYGRAFVLSFFKSLPPIFLYFFFVKYVSKLLATKIEEYVPTIIPAIRVIEKKTVAFGP